jgi:hypothetical protein
MGSSRSPGSAGTSLVGALGSVVSGAVVDAPDFPAGDDGGLEVEVVLGPAVGVTVSVGVGTTGAETVPGPALVAMAVVVSVAVELPVAGTLGDGPGDGGSAVAASPGTAAPAGTVAGPDVAVVPGEPPWTAAAVGVPVPAAVPDDATGDGEGDGAGDEAGDEAGEGLGVTAPARMPPRLSSSRVFSAWSG